MTRFRRVNSRRENVRHNVDAGCIRYLLLYVISLIIGKIFFEIIILTIDKTYLIKLQKL